jgi:hypothetical protein
MSAIMVSKRTFLIVAQITALCLVALYFLSSYVHLLVADSFRSSRQTESHRAQFLS